MSNVLKPDVSDMQLRSQLEEMVLDRPKDESYIFQPELSVTAPDEAAIFTKKAHILRSADADPAVRLEDDTMAMLYRRHVEFVVGHGVSVRANVNDDAPDRAEMLKTQVVPAYEVPQTTPPSADDADENPAFAKLKGLVHDMKELAECKAADFREKLGPIVTAYLLEQTGTRRWTTYSLSPQAAETPEEEQPVLRGRRILAIERRERIVELIAQRGTTSPGSISSELGIPRATLTYDLRTLLKDGRIERTTEDPKDRRTEYRVIGRKQE